MKSYTSLALIMLLGSAMPADSEKTLRRKLSIPPPNIDMAEAGGFISLSQLKHSSNADETEYGSTLEYATEYGNAIRNSYGKGSKKGSNLGTKATKQAKIPSISSQYGKDCPKKRKSGAKGGAKGSKSESPTASPAPSVSDAPSFQPSVSSEPTDSSAPSEAPSSSFKPSGWWCQDTDEPSSSPAPSESFAPSGVPTASPAPSISNEPSVSAAPSNEPSVSLEPSVSSAPSSSPTGKGGTSDGGSRTNEVTESSCTLYTATYEDGAAVLCNPAESQCPAADATAAVTAEVESDQDLEGALGYDVDVTFEVTSDPGSDVIADGLDATLSKPVVLTLVGCAGKARNVALEHYREFSSTRRRRLQDGTLAIMNNWSCDGVSNGEVTCSTRGFYEGSLSQSELQDRLRAQLAEYLALMDNIYPWYPMQSVSDSNLGVTTTNTPNGVVDDSDALRQGTGIRAGPFIGSATGMLAVLLLLVLFVRRRNRYDEENVSHLKLDDDGDDDTFYNGSETSAFQNEYNTRDVHIVGEGDSVVSHWTGYTGNEKPVYRDGLYRDGLMRGHSTDVHQCSSATCEICDKKRQAGVSFISTRTASFPSRSPSLPSDASREYIADDTVQL